MTAILRLQLDDKDPVRVNSAINQLAESYDRNARSRLTAAATFYVSTSGSDINSGSQASPFLTIQHAYDVITNTLDLGGQTVTIRCASGTYTAGLAAASPWTGGGQVILDLGGGTLNTAGGAIAIQTSLPAAFVIQNGTIIAGGNSINHAGTGLVSLGTGLIFGTSGGAHLVAGGAGSKILLTNSYAITGGGQFHYLAFKAGNSIEGQGIAVTLTGTPTLPAFSFAFALASRVGAMDLPSLTFSGSATGTRYSVDTNGVIYTGGGGANYFPGTIPGGTDGFGVYI